MEDASLPDEWLFRELNGGHLRLSTVVCCLCIKLNQVEIASYSWQIPPYLIAREESNGTIIYEGIIREIADYMAQALNVT